MESLDQLNALATAALIVPGLAESLRECASVGCCVTTRNAGMLAGALNALLKHQDTEAMQESADGAAEVLAGMLNPFASVSRVAINGDVWATSARPGSLVHSVCGDQLFAGVVYRVTVHVAGVSIPALAHLQGVETEDGEDDTAWRVPASAMRKDSMGDQVIDTWANFHHGDIFDALTN